MIKEFQKLSPMLLKTGTPFDSDEFIFEVKLDGIRCLCFIAKDKIILKTRHNRDITKNFPELSDIDKCIDKPCILDGELVILKDGKPDFYSLLKRTSPNSLNKPSKTESAAELAVFDILYIDNKDLTGLPLLDRKQILKQNIIPSNNLSLVGFTEGRGIDLFNAAKSLNLEGIVAKRKDSSYYPCKRSENWLKIKVFNKEEFLVLGFVYIPCDNKDKPVCDIDYRQIEKLILGKQENGTTIFKTTVNITMYKKAQSIVWEFYKSSPQANCPDYDNLLKNMDNIVILNTGLKCDIEYLSKGESGGLRHSVFKGIKF